MLPGKNVSGTMVFELIPEAEGNGDIDTVLKH